MVYILFSGKKEEYELNAEEIANYNKIIANTEFSFFQSLVKPVVIFDYYEDYALKLISELCAACGMQYNCSVEYSSNAKRRRACGSYTSKGVRRTHR